MNSIYQEFTNFEYFIDNILDKNIKTYKLDKTPFSAMVESYIFKNFEVHHCKHNCSLLLENLPISSPIHLNSNKNSIFFDFININSQIISIENINSIYLNSYSEYYIIKGNLDDIHFLNLDLSKSTNIDKYKKTLPNDLVDNSKKLQSMYKFIYNNLFEVISIKELANEFNYSERNIQLLFSKILNTSPKKLYLALRFNEARIALKKSSKDNKIYDIVSPLQFWHMGQFAKDYMEYFNEMPMQTLKK